MEKSMDALYEEKFQKLLGEKILLYGTGKIALGLINALSKTGFNVIGVLDRVRYTGEIEGVPIIMWDEVNEGDANAIIIAALPKNYRKIYNRIVDKCIAYNMKIFGTNGQDLIQVWGSATHTVEDFAYFQKTESDLLDAIDNHDAISFDLFDTLIMRKNLEPTDLFDIVEKRIRGKGIVISGFKKYRREAELQSNGGNIYKIYDVLQQMTGISQAEKRIILEEEISCEKEFIVPRKNMADMMARAYNSGKRVNIISNMYLPSSILKEILNEKGITEYEDIYVSCEYGVSKGNGLFERYTDNVNAKSYLHIGDDAYADIIVAKQHGLDAYEIKSAYEMLRISNLRRVLVDAHNSSEKGILGLLISELFNSPFALCGTNGIVRVSELKQLGKIFVAPTVILYMLKLIDAITDRKGYTGILFGARDGYLFKKIYDRLCMSGYMENPAIDSWYFMASRKLCFRSAMKTEENIKVLKYCCTGGNENILTQVLGIKGVFPYKKEDYDNTDTYLLMHKDAIVCKSNKTRQNYIKYMEKNGISLIDNYIFCDMIAYGSVQYALNQIFSKPIYGYYLRKRIGIQPFDLSYYSCYSTTDFPEWSETDGENKNFLEIILTSPEQSVEDMDKDGNPVFSKENRTWQEIEDVKVIQEGIEEFFFEYINAMYIEGETISAKFTDTLLRMHNEVLLEKECENIRKRMIVDDLSNQYIRVFETNHF